MDLFLCHSECICCCVREMCAFVSDRDKAGGYGIQALGGMLVEYVHGDFLNVVGFPLNHFCKQLDLIYNHSTSASDRECASVHLSHNGTLTTSVLTQPTSPNLPPQPSRSPNSPAKHNSSPNPRPNSPSASQTHHTHDGPLCSPVHKVSISLPTSTIHHILVLVIYKKQSALKGEKQRL